MSELTTLKTMLAAALLCVPALCSLAASGDSPRIRSLIEEANEHLGYWDITRYEATLERAQRAEGDATDRVEAAVALARDLWRFQHQPAEARRVLARARALQAKPAWPLLELADLETFNGNYAAACAAARSALSAAATGQEQRDARSRFGKAVCEEVLQATLRTAGKGTNAETEARVREAFALLEPVIQKEPGWREPSRCQILLALLVGNGPSALRAWHSYYLLVPGAPALRPQTESPRDFGDLAFVNGAWTNCPLPFCEPGEVLARLLPGCTNGVDAATRARVVRALAGSRLFPEAAALAARWQLPSDDTIRDIVIYGRWTDRLSRSFAEEFRRHALGAPYRTHIYIPYIVDADIGRTSLEALLESELKKLWQQRQQGPSRSPFSGPQSMIDLRVGFGAVARTVDPDTFSYGHSIWVSEEAIEQYGRKSVLRRFVLDSMVCNGFGDWLSGVTATGVGGWASPPSEFVQIRADWSLYVWQSLTEPDIYRRYILERLERLKPQDDERAKTNACGYFPGLSLRLYVRGNERLLGRLKDQGLSGPELRLAFLKERERLLEPALIIAHEGRHVLDLNDQSARYSGTDLEFRAKCSEVVFAPDPLLALSTGSIFSPNIGKAVSGHPMANARIMKHLLAWMQGHEQEIAGLDRSRPLLPQFDRLTDEQMRAAFRSMDPSAKTDQHDTRPPTAASSRR